ncbi:hypothetical protein TcBrA4_0139260 [Trypanosoma cruzi]|nr:hypothetical protein TcBrA4_0139260 [Trypanosoma cruzi]
MVLIHGFAGGLACWAQNWEFFSAEYELYAIDLPGFGRSERPCVNVSSLEGSMQFICGYMERWFCEMNFGRPVILLGHSFGGFVAAHYAMRHGPSRVKLLALADPWGVNAADPRRIELAPVHHRLALKIFYAVNPCLCFALRGLWDRSCLNLCARTLRTDGGVSWRAPKSSTSTRITVTRNSLRLERCFSRRAVTRMLLPKRLLWGCCQGFVEGDPVVLLYGSHTWMNAECGFTMVEKMAEDGYKAKADTVMNAGHQVFTDNVDAFNEKMSQMIRSMVREGTSHP